MYGPTETTVWSTIKDLTNTSTITIGKPIANTTCYILNDKKELLPIGTPGALYIGGDGVSAGYFNRNELTAEKFIKSPFRNGEIIYDTGDLAYINDSGEIIHLGRSDFQVKIRGHRIELGEIENKLFRFPNITDCVVNAVDNASKLCAYYISNKEINIKDLRSYLSKELPNYMIPNYFIKMESFPHTPNGKIDKKKLPLPSNPLINYVDYSEWEFAELLNDNFKEHKEFWLNQFDPDNIPMLDFPTDYSRPSIQSFEGAKVYKNIDAKLGNRIIDLAKSFDVSPFMLLLSAYYILLFKYTSQEDIIVGTPVIGRNKKELLNIIGMFVNTLPLKNHIEQNDSFNDLLSEVKTNCIKAFDHQLYPFDELVNTLNMPRNINRNPLFDTMFIYQSNGLKPFAFNDISASIYVPDANISKFDLSLEVLPKETGEFELNLEYCTKLFKPETIEGFASRFINIIGQVIDNSDLKIKDIDILTKEEKNKILYEFNNTKTSYPKDKTIIQLFEEQVKKTPDSIAVCFDGKGLTYRELNDKANSLALYLKENGVNHGDIVCMLFDKSLEMIVSILSILKLRAVYLPIDIGYPKDRIDYIVSDSHSKVILTTTDVSNGLTFDLPNLLCVDLSLNEIYAKNTSFDTVYSSPDEVAYVMYTSRIYW